MIVQYNPNLSEDDRAALEQWANEKQGVVVTPTRTPINAAFSAQTARLNFSCEQLELGQLSDFHTRWFSGTAG